MPLGACVICLQNHDQIGNRALRRPSSPCDRRRAWRAAITLLLTAPMTPLLFMGQEWAASTPFLFFTDFEPELGSRVAEGRRREFAAFRYLRRGVGAVHSGSAGGRDIRREPAATGRSATHRRTPAVSRCIGRCFTRRAERRALQASSETACDARALDDHDCGPPARRRRPRGYARRGALHAGHCRRAVATGALDVVLTTEDARSPRIRSPPRRHGRRLDHFPPAGRGACSNGRQCETMTDRPRFVPVSTYRLQVHGGFPLTAARDVVPYLARLGVGACYTSPYFAAAAGQHARLRRRATTTRSTPRSAAPTAHTAFTDSARARTACSTSSTSCPNHMGIGTGDEPVVATTCSRTARARRRRASSTSTGAR